MTDTQTLPAPESPPEAVPGATITPATRAERSTPYLIFILVLSVLSLVGLGLTTSDSLSPDEKHVLGIADDFICALFFLDFIVSMVKAPDRKAYFLRWGWLDLLSSIPMIDAFRMGRLARILRIIRILRGIRAARIIGQFLLGKRAESAFLAVSLISLLLVVVSSIAILQFEGHANSNITTAEDALWWSITTITTVGYGDRFPVTTEGRAIAAALMVCGVGLFGTLSGFIASWFLKPQQQQRDDDIAALTHEIRELRAALAATPLTGTSQTTTPAGPERAPPA